MGGVVVGKWRLLYLNNNKKRERERVRERERERERNELGAYSLLGLS